MAYDNKKISIGTRIRFLKDLDAPANEEHPAITFANKGEEGEIVSIEKCWEGYMVKRDSWPSPFGCEEKDFEVIEKCNEKCAKECSNCNNIPVMLKPQAD